MSIKSWEIKTLGEIATFKSGGTPSKSNPEYWGGDIPWVSAKDLKNSVVFDSIDKLTESGKSLAKLAPANSLLILVRGMTLHKDIPVVIAGRELAFNQDIKALVTSSEVIPRYLKFFLSSQKQRILKLVDSAGHGTGRLDTVVLKDFPVEIPPINEQTIFCELISSWEECIEKTERLIAAKKKQFHWLMRTLINTDSLLVKLGDIEGSYIVIEKGKPLKKSEILEGTIPVIAGGRSSPYSHNQSTHGIPCVTVSASGAAGYVWFHREPIWASDCNVIYSKNGKTEYLYFALKAQQKKIFSLQKGGGQSHVYASDLKSLNIYLPPIEEQNRIVNILGIA